MSEGAAGAKRIEVRYLDQFTREITDSLGRTATFGMHVSKGIGKVQSVSGEGCGACLGSLGEQYEYNERLLVTQETDALGVVTTFAYDERGNVLTRTEAVGTPEERTTTFTYHPTFNLVASITRSSVANPGQSATATFVHDERGNLLRQTESGFDGAGAITKTTAYSYNEHGQLTRVDGPRTDLNDVTVLEYYPNTPEQGLSRGRLRKITDPMGYETVFWQYNGFGKPGIATDPNNVVTSYTYDLMGRLTSRTVDSLTTTFTYDDAGALVLTRLPEGREFTYDYTDSGWLEKILALPGSVNYLYDTEGNRIREEIEDEAGTVLRYTQFEYDDKNRLYRTIYPDSNHEERGYDPKGNLLSLRDQNGKSTSYTYDPLNRLTSVTQPGSVITAYAYDKLDNLTRVTDAENHATTYTYDDLGRIVSTLSPDTNLTTYTYDPAGNLRTRTDANGITASYAYDVSNRLTRVSFQDSAQDIAFSYDQGVNGKGRLTAMTDPSGAYAYTYDVWGNLVTETRVTGGITFTTRYAYAQGGPLQGITYPSGRVVTYERDGAGRVIRVRDTMGGTTRTLADNVSHLPFGPLRGLTYGNGMAETRAFDELYRLTGLMAGSVMNLSYTHDPAGNILAISNLGDPARSQSFAYDDLQRLIGAQGVYGTEGYTYDKVGNRLQKTQNGQAEDYSYIPGTNKLQAIAGQTPLSFSYDANGNTLQMGEQGFTHNQDNRLLQASLRGAVVGEYTYNGRGERTRKTAEGKTTLYIYDKDGSLISEADHTGAIVRDYVYLGGKLLSHISSEPPKDVEVRVSTSRGRKLASINVYAFTQAGAYTGKSAKTDGQGLAVFQSGLLAEGSYKFRADYLSYQFWSPVTGVPGGNAADLVIEEERATLTVTVAGAAKPGVNVYLFNGSGSYLGLYQVSDGQGKVSFDLPVGKVFKFRADYMGSQYWSSVMTIQAGAQNAVTVATGGGSLTVSLNKDENTPIAGVKLYLFSLSGTYLGLWGTSGETGQVSYTLPGGQYKVRADYMGYQFWSDVVLLSGAQGFSFTIPHEDVEVSVRGENAGQSEPRVDVPAYLFTSSGMYLSVTARTNSEGKVVFSLPQKEYKMRADYLGSQFWSEVFTWEDKTLLIREGAADVTVASMGLPIQGVKVYAFTATGSYLSLHQSTDGQGKASFRLPEGRYKFRADYMGSQYWSGDCVLIPGVVNPVPISTGGGAFTLKVEKAAGVPLAGASCYLFSGSGAYLGRQVVTSGAGEAGFNLADGSYRIRVDYLGHQYWTTVFSVPGASTLTHTIPHQAVTVTVTGDCSGDVEPKGQVNTYLFTASGAYVSVTAKTDAEGKAVFSVPPREYKVRADYLGAQYWSDLFVQTDRQILIREGTADVFVNQNGTALANVNVYVFSAAGSYLSVHGVSGGGGAASFRLPEGTYRFRGDYQGSQFWVTETIQGNEAKSVNLNTGGGLFTLRVEKTAGVALADKPVYVFTPSGSYLNLTAHTNAQGEATFGLAAGWYRFRVDHMGYQFWCDALEVPSTLSHTMGVQHRDSTITVNTFYTGAMVPLEGMSSYLFTESGAYLNVSVKTDGQGQVKFNVPDQSYKVRVDYLGGQYWSEVFRWQDRDVVIDEGQVDLHVTWNGAEVGNAAVYLFTDTGSYLNRSGSTDGQGHARFTVPVKPYKFRIDHGGRQYWTGVITPIAHQQLGIEVPLEQLALMPTNDPLRKRYDGEAPIYIGEPVKVASIGSLVGILSQTAVAQAYQPKVYYYLTDHLGTPQKLTDATGAVVWSADYKPFGEIASGVSTIQNHFRFPGQYYDKETGLHYNYHRYYTSKKGGYTTPDPIGLLGGINLFAYARNNPLAFDDKEGLWHPEGHKDLTMKALQIIGNRFSRADAIRLIRANVGVDQVDPLNNAAHYMPGYADKAENLVRKYLELAILMEQKGMHDMSMYLLGAGLHTVQDRYSHCEKNAGWKEHIDHYIYGAPDPDDPALHPIQYERALQASILYLNAFLQGISETKR